MLHALKSGNIDTSFLAGSIHPEEFRSPVRNTPLSLSRSPPTQKVALVSVLAPHSYVMPASITSI